jgi:UPF0755 protein
MGLPPTPIANPGEDAMRAATNPPPGDWLYFVTVKPGDTRFTASYEEHLRNVAEFNQNRSSASPTGTATSSSAVRPTVAATGSPVGTTPTG